MGHNPETVQQMNETPPIYTNAKKRWVDRMVFLTPFLKNRKALTGLILFFVFIFVAIFAHWIAPYSPANTNFMMSLGPTSKHLFGTTNTGQDIFSEFIFGARTTIVVGFGAGLIATFLGLLIGITAGYRGGWIDSILTFLMNLFLVLPGLALLIVIESYVKNSSPYTNGIIIGLTGWAWGARVFRAQTMSLVNRDFVVAAKMSGKSDLNIMFTEISPNMMSIIAANVIYATLGAVLAESGLAFLGIEDINSISWGTMLYWASQSGAMLTGAWWWIIPPGLGIGLVGLSLVLMNFAIDSITNPRLSSQKRRRHRVKQQSTTTSTSA
ncbi:ABC transporter permease [Paenibacillus sediminis]|uniref:Peptide/nickel transport system permease protein n=1 Tax=Paenibacillus sediminis TaxID=664909 RepID=A0ABS4H136_9BACL|nr:ABC transporter permease [Paenibacillus sediminis]MBP1936239.1 peptide/nickel transport system permease protein [Paenibacillus sediminis]